jgi:hypothetical protein
MTRRYTSGFDILGFDTDPTPGDPDTILNQVVPFYQSIGDDSQSAVTALKSNAITSGSGQTMAALSKLISSDYPPKLQKAADSFHSAASIYTAYAQSLAEAQNQVDQAMDQATPVAATANTTVQPAPANATAAQTSAVQQQQQNVDQANTQLTAAKRLGQDAKDLRDQAGSKFNQNLNDVSAIPGESIFQEIADAFKKIGEFIKDNIKAILEIIVDVAIAITSIFFPVVGLVLGAIAFAATQIADIATHHFDLGSFVAGLLTLGIGAGSAAGLFEGAIGALKTVGTAAAGVFKSAGTAGEDAAGAVGEAGEAAAGDAGEAGSYFGSAPGTAADGVQESSSSILGKLGATAKSVGTSVKNAASSAAGTPLGKAAVSTLIQFGLGTVPTVVGDVIDHKPVNVGEVLGGAAAGAVVGGAFRGAKAGFGFDEPSESADDLEPDEPTSPTAEPSQSGPPQLPPIDTGGRFDPFGESAPTDEPTSPIAEPTSPTASSAPATIGHGSDVEPDEPTSPTSSEHGSEASSAGSTAEEGLTPTQVKIGTAFTQAGSIAAEATKTGTQIGVAHREHDTSESDGERVDEGAQSVEPSLADGKFL